MTVAAAGLAALGHAADLLRLKFCRVVLPHYLYSTSVLSFCPTGPDDDFQRFARYHIEQRFDEGAAAATSRLLALQVTRRAAPAPQLHFELSEAHHDLVLVGSRDAMQGNTASQHV